MDREPDAQLAGKTTTRWRSKKVNCRGGQSWSLGEACGPQPLSEAPRETYTRGLVRVAPFPDRSPEMSFTEAPQGFCHPGINYPCSLCVVRVKKLLTILTSGAVGRVKESSLAGWQQWL